MYFIWTLTSIWIKAKYLDENQLLCGIFKLEIDDAKEACILYIWFFSFHLFFKIWIKIVYQYNEM